MSRTLIVGAVAAGLLAIGAAPDRLSGGGGDDKLKARGGGVDVLRCGKGKDEAIVDERDRVRGCEKVRRNGKTH